MDTGDHNNIIINGEFSHMPSVSLPQSNFPVLPLLQGQTMNNLPPGFMTSNHADLVQLNAWIPRNIPIELNKVTDSSLRSSRPISNTDNQDRFMVGTSNPLEFLESSTSKNHYLGTLNSAFATAVNCGYDEVLGGINNKWASDKFLPHSDASMEIPGMVGFHPFPTIGNINPNCWTSSDNGKLTLDSSSGSSKFSNNLSVNLTTFQPSVIHRPSIQDRCSEISYSGVTRRQFGSETSCNSNGSPSPVQLSELLYGSRYLPVIQEILAEIASCSFSPGSLSGRGYAVMSSDGDGRCEVQNDLPLDRREVEAKKKQFLVLLQMVDERYAQCLGHIHTVVSAFHAASELDPHIHARFALQTVSSLYENLREKISNQILAMEGYFHRRDTKEEDQERSFETSFIQKQWALQRIRRKDHQLWRPQRGLPERSVSVLRAWMFQNFLHPYPKDAEKHLLAVRSGLTRSQVSNWFINARVRLWKPMIDEMYSEMNRRKGHTKAEERDRSHLIID